MYQGLQGIASAPPVPIGGEEWLKQHVGQSQAQADVQAAKPKPRIDRLVIERVTSGFLVSTTEGENLRHAVSTLLELLTKVRELLA